MKKKLSKFKSDLGWKPEIKESFADKIKWKRCSLADSSNKFFVSNKNRRNLKAWMVFDVVNQKLVVRFQLFQQRLARAETSESRQFEGFVKFR